MNYTLDPCRGEETGLELRFYMVSVFGSTVAMFGVVENTLLAYIFLTRDKFRESSAFLLALVALFDVIMDGCYIMLFPISIAFEYFHSLHLHRLWFKYVRIVFTVGQISGNASSYLLIGAAYERCKISGSWTLKAFTPIKRMMVAGFAILLAMVVKLSLYWERSVNRLHNCTNELFSMEVRVTPLVYENPLYQYVWTFWMRYFLSAFLPFIVLLTLNLGIISRLRKQKSNLSLREKFMELTVGKNVAAQQKAQVRSATQTLIVISGTHLVGHLLNIVLAVHEVVHDFKPTEFEMTLTYSILIELSSIFRISSNVLRLPIYFLFDTKIRKELATLVLYPKGFNPVKRHNSGIYR